MVVVVCRRKRNINLTFGNIRKATEDDIDEIKSIADTHRYELGFIRRPSILERIAKAELFVATKRGEVVGFVDYHHRRDEQTTLYHIVVTGKWRGKGIGRLLFEALILESVVKGKRLIKLKCPAELLANQFYRHLGLAWVERQNGNKRTLNVWVYRHNCK